MEPCPVCRSPLIQPPVPTGTSSRTIHCPRCGHFSLGDRATALLDQASGNQRAVVSYAIHRMPRQKYQPVPQVAFEDVQNILKTERLPSPPQQANLLILLLGRTQPSNIQPLVLSPYCLEGEIGAAISGDAGVHAWQYFADYLKEQQLITYHVGNDEQIRLMLTIPGWSRFEELQRETSDSRAAFMAMKFGDDELDALFREHLTPAVADTGFRLERLDTNPKPGLIDARMDVEIRAARFMVADLTQGSHGAYWEAGFAAGLGRPVFYTCKKEYFEREGPHFDTSHHYTVLWEPAAPEKAMEELKAAIRRAFPADSKIRDGAR
jgi:hypothetical protein